MNLRIAIPMIVLAAALFVVVDVCRADTFNAVASASFDSTSTWNPSTGTPSTVGDLGIIGATFSVAKNNTLVPGVTVQLDAGGTLTSNNRWANNSTANATLDFQGGTFDVDWLAGNNNSNWNVDFNVNADSLFKFSVGGTRTHNFSGDVNINTADAVLSVGRDGGTKTPLFETLAATTSGGGIQMTSDMTIDFDDFNLTGGHEMNLSGTGAGIGGRINIGNSTTVATAGVINIADVAVGAGGTLGQETFHVDSGGTLNPSGNHTGGTLELDGGTYFINQSGSKRTGTWDTVSVYSDSTFQTNGNAGDKFGRLDSTTTIYAGALLTIVENNAGQSHLNGTYQVGLHGSADLLDATSYQIVDHTDGSTFINASFNDTNGLWSNADAAGTITASLDTGVKAGTIDATLTDSIDINGVMPGAKDAGWVEIENLVFGADYQLDLSLENFSTDIDAVVTEMFANDLWNSVTADDVNDIVSGTFTSSIDGNGFFAWENVNSLGADVTSLSITNLASTQAVPEPASVAIWSLFGLALLGFGCYRARSKN